MARSSIMTIGKVSRRTGVSIKTLREYERLGLLYTRGRSEGNYRLFGEETLWCIELIRTLRSLGLTLKEIQDVLCSGLPEEPIGPRLGEKLEDILTRINTRIAELQQLREHIHAFQALHAPALAGESELPLLAANPGCPQGKSAS